MMFVTKFIKSSFKKYPLLSNCCTYGCMTIAAELSQQTINRYTGDPSQRPDKFDFDSLKRFAIYGFVINPNILYFWYRWLDAKFVGTAKRTVLKKVLCDQFIMTPPIYVLFYTGMRLMEGKPDIFAECRAKFGATFATSCIFWLPAQTINFLFVPTTTRVAFVGSCSFIWINILCWLKRKDI